jgi:hypothetical protein
MTDIGEVRQQAVPSLPYPSDPSSEVKADIHPGRKLHCRMTSNTRCRLHPDRNVYHSANGRRIAVRLWLENGGDAGVACSLSNLKYQD